MQARLYDWILILDSVQNGSPEDHQRSKCVEPRGKNFGEIRRTQMEGLPIAGSQQFEIELAYMGAPSNVRITFRDLSHKI
jgi:hypothetical protein